MGDKYDEAVSDLESELLCVEGVEATVVAVYVPGRKGGDVAISFNQGLESGSMTAASMCEFVEMLITNLLHYRTHLQGEQG